MIVGISGKMQSGKDTVADRLVTRFGFRRIALADALKFLAKEQLGWDGNKDDKGRALLQRLGTEVAKTACKDTVWVNILHRYMMIIDKYHDGNVNFVIPDVRFNCEAEWITGGYNPDGLGKLKDGFLINVNRSGAAEMATGDIKHKSEMEMDSPKFKIRVYKSINNNSSVEELHTKTDSLYDELVTRVYNLPR